MSRPRKHQPTPGNPRQDELTSLALRLSHGDVQAMGEFYDLTCHVTYGLARGLLGRNEGTEALLCDAYVDAWLTIRQTLPAPGSEMCWVLALVLRRYRLTGTPGLGE